MYRYQVVSWAAFIMQALVVIFCVAATPSDAFRSKQKDPATGAYTCYAMRGVKQCGAHGTNVDGKTDLGFPCHQFYKTMTAAFSFSIISIVLGVVTLVFAGLLVARVYEKGCVPGVMAVINVVIMFFPWMCINGAYTEKCDGVNSIESTYKYGPAFGLFICAWVFQIGSSISLFVA